MFYKMNLYKICFYGCKSNVKLTTVSVVNFVHHKSTIVKPEELQLPNDKKQWNVPVGFNTGARIYNCIAKTNVPLILQNKNFVSWYMCGPTVYDSAHIGHACCYMKFDIIRRILTNFLGVNLVMVMGITDIDDKIIDKAREHNTDIKRIASQYEAEFFQDIKDLSITPPTLSARVSDYIPSIISFVQKIIDAGFAYVTDDGSVYFDTSHYPQYGKLSSQASEENRTPRPEKRSPTDFALWKGAKPGEPWWNSPWGAGKGRPGWHIECSAIASELFGRNIDIHSGGIDLIFPHHENEEAQCCAYHNVPQWVNYWMHSGHLYLKGSEKMSKSLKNTISIQEFLKSFTANQFRMLCLLSPYRNNIEYTDSTMENAVAVLKKIESFLDDCEAYISGYKAGAIDESEWMQALSETREKFSASLLDDFDTAKGMNAVVQFITKGNRMLKTEPSNNEHSRSPAVVAAAVNHIRHIMQLLGVTILRKDEVLKTEADAVPVKVDEILDCMLQFRSTVRETALQRSLDGKNSDASEKNEVLLKACDSLRESLSAAGVQLKDHGKMSSWSLVGGNRKKR